jgi:phage terminase large subunit-like protein
VKPTIDGGGKMIVLSTANGAGNLFHDMVEKAKKELSRFAFRFLPWWARPGRDAAWYASVEADAIDSSLMKQEYPATPDEAFEASEVDSFLSSISLWDACKEELPLLDAHTPCVLALDAAESNDTFGTVIVSKHPGDGTRLAVRYVKGYAPTPGVPLDFDAIEQDIRGLVARYAIQQIAYDPMLLGQTIRRLTSGRNAIAAPCEPFPQGAARLESDKGLYDLITQRKIAHDGNEDLRTHIKNANRKVDTESRKLRIVKRAYPLKIDLCVALAMGCARASAILLRLPARLPASHSIRTW